MNCPCHPGSTYSVCCERFHNRLNFPETAEQLMRSRYSAFVLGLVDYIVETTVPSQQIVLNRARIAEWSEKTDWQGLKVIKHTPKLGKRHAQVAFNALFKTADGMQAHHEVSTFVNIMENQQSRWYFLDPTVDNHLTQKQPCLCGSGEKFKRCCGQFLKYSQDIK